MHSTKSQPPDYYKLVYAPAYEAGSIGGRVSREGVKLFWQLVQPIQLLLVLNVLLLFHECPWKLQQECCEITNSIVCGNSIGTFIGKENPLKISAYTLVKWYEVKFMNPSIVENHLNPFIPETLLLSSCVVSFRMLIRALANYCDVGPPSWTYGMGKGDL